MKQKFSYFITATDTDVGKTIITGLLANYFTSKNIKTITQKWIQTGNEDFSEDLQEHFELMDKNIEDFDDNILKIMCPYLLKLPASPHLAARMENVEIDKNEIMASYELLMSSEFCDAVVVEGSGGVFVPYNEQDFLIDVAKELEIPVIIVSINKLGTINHTLLTIEALKKRNINIKGIIFNNPHKKNISDDEELILQDNIKIIEKISGVQVLGEVNYSDIKSELVENFEKIGDRISITK